MRPTPPVRSMHSPHGRLNLRLGSAPTKRCLTSSQHQPKVTSSKSRKWASNSRQRTLPPVIFASGETKDLTYIVVIVGPHRSPEENMPKRKELSKKPPEVAAGYAMFLSDLKQRIRQAQVRAALSVNRELVLLYWQMGKRILEQQGTEGWGTKVIDQLSRDLRREFPIMKGFSPRNLKYMRAFAESYPDEEFVQQVAAQIPWFHNCVLLDKTAELAERAWYARSVEDIAVRTPSLIFQESLIHTACSRKPISFTKCRSISNDSQTDRLLLQ